MATYAFNNATYDFNETTLNKVSNNEIKVALADLQGESFEGQSELFEVVGSKLNEDQFLVFKRNEITNFIQIKVQFLKRV